MGMDAREAAERGFTGRVTGGPGRELRAAAVLAAAWVALWTVFVAGVAGPGAAFQRAAAAPGRGSGPVAPGAPALALRGAGGHDAARQAAPDRR